ncbi:hypothetical protein QQF64_008215 [Cirrhinus molitorella]|uniref:Uncharacterized protein n=1 Tax=Cirrhinus molitorella TaxID=172907 RepID=A0ABR3M9K4_9TELE
MFSCLSRLTLTDEAVSLLKETQVRPHQLLMRPAETAVIPAELLTNKTFIKTLGDANDRFSCVIHACA